MSNDDNHSNALVKMCHLMENELVSLLRLAVGCLLRDANSTARRCRRTPCSVGHPRILRRFVEACSWLVVNGHVNIICIVVKRLICLRAEVDDRESNVA